METQSKPNRESGANVKKNVICILSQEQYDEYENELSGMKAVGANLTLVEDPDEALAMISKAKPDMIIVGMDLGDTEGFEFLAMLTSSVPDYENPAVVLPDKADGLPPVVHSRNQDTGHSAVNGVDFNYITSLLYPTESNKPDSPHKTIAESEKKESPSSVDEPKTKPVVDQKTALDQEPKAKPVVDQKTVLNEEPEAKPTDEEKPIESKDKQEQPFDIDFPNDSNAPEQQPTPDFLEPPRALLEDQEPVFVPSSSSKIDRRYLMIGGGISLVLILSVGGYLALSGSDTSKNPESASQNRSVAASSANDEDKQGVGDEVDDQSRDEVNPTPNTASDKAALAVDTTQETGEVENKSVDESIEENGADIGLELPKELVLPLFFEKSSSEAEISDEQRFDQIIRALSSKENAQIVLTGHASVQGSNDINYKLGLQRAESAKKLLTERGVPSDRIRTASLGSHVPISDRAEEEEQQHNRRVTVTLQ